MKRDGALQTVKAAIFVVGCISASIVKLLTASREVPNVEYLGFAGLMTSAALLFQDRHV